MHNLKRVLREDRMSALFKVYRETAAAIIEQGSQFEDIMNALEKATSDPATSAELMKAQRQDDIWRVAELLAVDAIHLREFIEFNKNRKKSLETAIGLPNLKRSWKALLRSSPIEVLASGRLPATESMPCIVFFSADWCTPCQVTKPTFARLAKYFDKSRLFYCSDHGLQEQEGVDSIPRLVAYFPHGAKIHSTCGGSAEELWNNMNLLITLGKGFKGQGNLVCSKGECKIVPMS